MADPIPETTACDCQSADWNRPLTAALEIERLRNEREMRETTDEVVAALRGGVPGIGSAAMTTCAPAGAKPRR